jgi:hypothetical protein
MRREVPNCAGLNFLHLLRVELLILLGVRRVDLMSVLGVRRVVLRFVMLREKELMMFSERVLRVVLLVRPFWRSFLAASYLLILAFCCRLCLTT